MQKSVTTSFWETVKPPICFLPFLSAARRTFLLTLGLTPLLTQRSPALTITDNFTNALNWGAPLIVQGTANMSVGSGRMNYTSTSTNHSGTGLPRNTPLLPTTQDWSLKVDAHVDPFALITNGHYIDVFLGFAKTSDPFNNLVLFEFDRGWWSQFPGYDIGDDITVNGVGVPELFTIQNLSSPDASLRMDYTAVDQSLTFYFDNDGAANGYQWVAMGAAGLASGVYDMNLGETDTFTVVLAGSSELQTVAAGQAYLSNLVISISDISISPSNTVANTSQPEFALSSASDGTNFLIGIYGHTTSANAAGAQLLSSAGTRVGSFISTGRTMDGVMAGPRVAFGSTNYLMIWTDEAAQHASTGNDIYGRFVSRAGSPVGAAFAISSASGDQYALGVAFDGTNFLAIWSDASGLHGRRISHAGGLLASELVFTAEDVQEAGAITYGGGQYLVAWVEGTDGAHTAKGQLVSPSGVLGSVLSLSQNDSYFYNPISVTYGADRFLAVWHHNADAVADWNLRGRLVLTNGTFVGNELTLVDGPVDEIAWANNVAFDGQDFLLVWLEADSPLATNGVVWGRYWKLTGEADGSPFLVEGNPVTKLGVGLSSGAGRVLVVINTGLLAPEADVYARLIARRNVALKPAGPAAVEITFAGVLQYSTNLTSWADYSPQPVSPWTRSTAGGPMFFRTR